MQASWTRSQDCLIMGCSGQDIRINSNNTGGGVNLETGFRRINLMFGTDTEAAAHWRPDCCWRRRGLVPFWCLRQAFAEILIKSE